MAAVAQPRSAIASAARRLGGRPAARAAGEPACPAAPELALTTWLAAHHLLSQIVVFWYVNVHGAVTFAVFGWLWWRRPDLLPPLRTAPVVRTAGARVRFWSLPVAPPRMLISDGYVDLVAAVNHVPVWQAGAT